MFSVTYNVGAKALRSWPFQLNSSPGAGHSLAPPPGLCFLCLQTTRLSHLLPCSWVWPVSSQHEAKFQEVRELRVVASPLPCWVALLPWSVSCWPLHTAPSLGPFTGVQVSLLLVPECFIIPSCAMASANSSCTKLSSVSTLGVPAICYWDLY